MALPSAITLGSAALVVVAGVGLAAVATAGEAAAPDHVATKPTTPATTTAPTAPPATTPATKTRPTHHQKAKPRAHRADPVPKVFVEVYNNSGVTGLAAEKARVLESAGWNVTATDNWYGDIPQSTVYYPGKLQDDARRLAKVLHITRTRPAVSPMQFDRLTVILTSR